MHTHTHTHTRMYVRPQAHIYTQYTTPPPTHTHITEQKVPKRHDRHLSPSKHLNQSCNRLNIGNIVGDDTEKVWEELLIRERDRRGGVANLVDNKTMNK